MAHDKAQYFAVRRWVTLVASTIPAVCCGFYYAWSVVVRPLMDMHGWTSAEVSLAFTLVVAMPVVMTLVAGKLLKFFRPPTLLLVSGVILGCGTGLLGSADSLPLFYLFAFIAGVGGMAYPGSTMSNLLRFFPDHRGLASGVLTGGFGLGAVIWGPVTVWMLDLIGIRWTFRVLGMLFAVVIALCSRFVTVAPDGYLPPGREHSAQGKVSSSREGAQAVDGITWRAMLGTLDFWLLAAAFVLGLISGLMVTSHASPIAQQMLGISPQAAGVFVSYLAVGMVIGKVGWGALSDRVGRLPVLVAILALAVGAMLLLWRGGGYAGVVTGVFVVGICYGGFLALVSPLTLETFGPRDFNFNYGIMYLTVGVAAYVGPRLAATVAQANSGDYEQAFMVAAVLAGIGLGLALAYIGLRWRKTCRSLNYRSLD
ncbi:MAG: OFA family MFS transporter [Thermoleophilia bacterium]|nr:OFA family MFS transporter [Thermoleophilia bacterium]